MWFIIICVFILTLVYLLRPKNSYDEIRQNRRQITSPNNIHAAKSCFRKTVCENCGNDSIRLYDGVCIECDGIYDE